MDGRVVDILQTDINHVGGISGSWKVAATAAISGISMAPHACEGPIGGLATIHVDAAMPNFLVQEICGQVKPSAADKVWEDWFGGPTAYGLAAYLHSAGDFALPATTAFPTRDQTTTWVRR